MKCKYCITLLEWYISNMEVKWMYTAKLPLNYLKISQMWWSSVDSRYRTWQLTVEYYLYTGPPRLRSLFQAVQTQTTVEIIVEYHLHWTTTFEISFSGSSDTSHARQLIACSYKLLIPYQLIPTLDHEVVLCNNMLTVWLNGLKKIRTFRCLEVFA
jgi:hypothetical protein